MSDEMPVVSFLQVTPGTQSPLHTCILVFVFQTKFQSTSPDKIQNTPHI